MFISAALKSDSVTHVQTSFLIFFPYGLSSDIQYSSLCYTQDLVAHPSYVYWFASANSKVPLHPSSTPLLLGNHKPVLYACEPVSVS